MPDSAALPLHPDGPTEGKDGMGDLVKVRAAALPRSVEPFRSGGADKTPRVVHFMPPLCRQEGIFAAAVKASECNVAVPRAVS